MKSFDRSLPMMLYRTLNAVMPAFRAIFAQFDLTEQQWRVLRVLWERDAKPLLELAQATLIQAPSLVGIVDRLQRNGLVERRRSDLDRRVVRVCLTAAGRALEAQVIPLVDAAYSDLEGLVSKDEWKSLISTLAKMADRAGASGAEPQGEPLLAANN